MTFREYRVSRVTVARALTAIMVGVSGNAFAQGPAPNKPDAEGIYLYRGADREQKLLASAKREGSLAWFTTFTAEDGKVLTDAFEKKYGVKVTLWRTRSEKIVQRLLTEARAGRHEADVVEMDSAEMEVLRREQLLANFYSPGFQDLAPGILPSHRQYVPVRFNLYTLAYNTKLVRPEDVPNSYEDLLHPNWTGRLGIETTDVAWFASVVKAMGEERGLAYFKKLAEMKPDMRTSHILVAQLVAAGEIPLVITAYNHNVETLKYKGAPVEWKPLAPAFGMPSSVGVLKRSPRPHAALLFADFLLAREGQALIAGLNRAPASRAVDSALTKFPYQVIDSGIVLDEWEKWERSWSALFLKGRSVTRE